MTINKKDEAILKSKRKFVKVFIINKKGEVLLVKEKNASSRTWDFPGGKVEASDYEKTQDKSLTPRDQDLKTYKFAAVEGLKEECNIDVNPKLLNEIFRIGHIFNEKFWYGIYLSLVLQDDTNVKNNEPQSISEVRFFKTGDALQILCESYPTNKKRLLRDIFKTVNFSK